MTDWREELVEKMAKAIAARPQDSEDRWWIWEPEARAALAVAEPVIREQCAKIADKTPYAFNVAKDMNTIAAAIREGGNDG